MKLSYDCMRDVLILLEEHLTVDADLCFSEMSINDIMAYNYICDRYSIEEVAYSVHNLYQCDFVSAEHYESDDALEYRVYDVTYTGHEFLATVRSDNVWHYIKEQLKHINIANIPTIVMCAKRFIDAAFNK